MDGLYGKMNAERIKYFNIYDLVKGFKLNSDSLEHLQDVSFKFDEYMKNLTAFNNRAILRFLIESFNSEIYVSNLIEDHLIKPQDISESDSFFDSLSISHKRIKDLHKELTKEHMEYEYRDEEAWVHSVRNGIETIYWYAVEPEDIKKFMNDFITFYRNKSTNLVDSSLFIKTSLVHLLFMRIHPFKDGNGRTSRILHDMKFVEMVNKVYGYNLRISPLHLSQGIWRNRNEYYKRINALSFDLNHVEENNEALNNWIQFILNMYEEELNFMNSSLSNCKSFLESISSKCESDDVINKEANKLKIKRYPN